MINIEAAARTAFTVIVFLVGAAIVVSFPKISLGIVLSIFAILAIKENYKHNLFQVTLRNKFKNQNKFEGDL
jgi:hypothetical protein